VFRQNSSSFGCEAVACAVGQPNVLECVVVFFSVDILSCFLSLSIGGNGLQLKEVAVLEH